MRLPRVPQRTTPGFAFSIVDRSLATVFADRRFGKEEMKAVLEFFGRDPPECAFCGGVEVRRWDHLVPVKRGGDTLLGNMVLACATCDDSKRDLNFEEWMVSTAPGSPASRHVRYVGKRIERIRAYVTHHGYSPKGREQHLSPDEANRIAAIQRKLQEVRQEMDDLIRGFRLRTQRK